MVKFLLEHALALEEKEEPENMAADAESSTMLQNIHFERGRVTQGIIMDLENVDSAR